MELRIYNPQEDGFVQKIEWNYEELKTEVAAAADEYAVSVYTDETIKQAKADRAKLNKFVDALKGKRTEIRRKLLEPDGPFGQEVQDIIMYLPFERVMKPEYALASTTMKSIKEEILSLIQKVDEGLAILNEVDSPYVGEMKEVFLRTYDIGAAMAERNRLEAAEQKRQEYVAEQARIKAERDARIKAEAQEVINAGKPVQTAPAPAPQPKTETVEDPVNVIDFRVYVTRSQAVALKDFLNNNGIRFEPVPKR